MGGVHLIIAADERRAIGARFARAFIKSPLAAERSVGQALMARKMTAGEREIRDGLRRRSLTPDKALLLVDAELKAAESASLLVLRAVLVQLAENPALTLEDARISLERAVELAPDDPEAYEELGHFFDAVVPDRDRAVRLYRLALAKGAGPSCQTALDELLAE